jgi:hypothetical protein
MSEKYDDASWHYGGDFPTDLPHEAGATHSAMFVAWALLNGLSGEIHIHDFPDDISPLRVRAVTPGQFFLTSCDGKFIEEDLNDEGNAFVRAYFDFESGSYLTDYARVLAVGLPSYYHVPDTWETFDQLRPVLDARFQAWRLER